MPESHVFVVPVDFSPEMESTVSAAVAIARHCHAELHLLEVVAPRPPAVLNEKRTRHAGGPPATTGDWSRLEGSTKATGRGRPRLRAFTYRGDPTEVIPAYLLQEEATLMVVGQFYGTSRWRRSTRFVATLSRAAPVPVLVLPSGYRARTAGAILFRRIVSAVDFTIASAVTMRTVVDLSRRSGAELHLVHSLSDSGMALSGAEAAKATRHLQAQRAHAGARLRRRIPEDLRIRVVEHVATSNPHRAILDVASKVEADLIVLGVPPRSRLDEVLSGSTLRNVLRRMNVPVLVLPVPAGAYKCLEDSDGIEIQIKQKRARRSAEN